VQLSLTADIGRVYALQSSSNLVQWVTLTNFFNQQSTFQFVDMNPGAWPQRFYRVRWAAP
jgi:hypothetical protein